MGSNGQSKVAIKEVPSQTCSFPKVETDTQAYSIYRKLNSQPIQTLHHQQHRERDTRRLKGSIEKQGHRPQLFSFALLPTPLRYFP